MTSNIAEVLKLAAKPIQYDNDERTWLEFLFKLENYLTLVNEKYVDLLQHAESQPVANLPGGDEEPAATIRTLSRTLYALLATLTPGRSFDWCKQCRTETGSKRGGSWRRKTRQKTAGRRFAMLQAVLQPRMGDAPAKFEEMWKSWEHQVDVYENLSVRKLEDDVKISVVLREAPPKLRDHLLVSSQQFESSKKKLRAIIQAYLNSNKTLIANDFRGSDSMEVDHISKGKSKSKCNIRGNSRGKSKGKSRDRNQAKGKRKSKGNEKPDNDRECYVCGKKGHLTRYCWPRANHDKT